MGYKDYKTTKDRLGDYDTDSDRELLLGVIVTIIIGVLFILGAPNVEAIGEWVFNALN